MIPLSLRLYNFMSYGEEVPRLDFSQITTACLTGDNGHGKSALLDAMTWVLWGQTRAKNLDDVVRLGQREMEVEFEFDLEGQRYRVLRKRSLRTKAGQSSLELQGFDPATNRYMAISGNSIRETEAKIVQLLHMNYDTFINSVLVLQGRADEFTTRRPGERKRILAEILGLSLFDDLEARARAHRNELDQEVRMLNVRLEELQEEVARKDELAAAVTSQQEELATMQAELHQAHEHFDHLRQRHHTLEFQSQQAHEVSRRLQQVRHELLEIEQQLVAHNNRMADYQAVLIQESTITAGYGALQRLKEEERISSARAQEYATLQQRQSNLQQAITTAQHRLDLERQSAGQRLRDMDDKIQACEAILHQAPRITSAYEALLEARQRDVQLTQAMQQRYALEQEKHQVEQRIQQQRHALELEQRSLLGRQQDLQRKEGALPTWQQEVEDAHRQLAVVEQQDERSDQVRAEGASLKVQIEEHIPHIVQNLQQEIHDHQEKQSLLRTAEAHCPLCEKALTDVERQRVMRKLAQEIVTREVRIQELQGEQHRLQVQRQALRTEYKHLEHHRERRKALEQQYATAQANLTEAIRARDALASLLDALQQLEAQLTSGSYAPDDLARLSQLTAELNNLPYDQQEHQTIKQQLTNFAPAEGEKSRLQQAEAELIMFQERRPDCVEEVARIERMLQSKQYAIAEQSELHTIEEKLAGLDFHPNIYTDLRQQLQEHQHFERQHLELETARKHLDDERAAMQHLEAKKQRCATDVTSLENEQQQFARETSALEELQAALTETESKLQRLRDREGDIRLRLGRTQSQYEHCLQREAELQQRTVQRDQAVGERAIYSDLAQMFGKNGIQAIIIENAIPELEDEANRILTRVTDNAMHLTLETQRDTRSGNVAETLDIKISDELGTRNYELFSGGEAFRINFALRIALSKMLARRAGARLRTLVIDEGFGTQDSQGLERLVEVIKAIQDDFAKIIVITHLRELKNAFDIHIEVKKDPLRGSFYQVM
jgi:exonuclease SbcC